MLEGIEGRDLLILGEEGVSSHVITGDGEIVEGGPWGVRIPTRDGEKFFSMVEPFTYPNGTIGIGTSKSPVGVIVKL